MRRTTRRIIIIAMFICYLLLNPFASVQAANEGAKNLRDFLINSKYVTDVYPIDEYHTFVIPETNLITSNIKGDFDDEFFGFCKNKGALESQILMSDPLTGKEITVWKTLDLDSKNSFTNPKTGNREALNPEMLYRGIPFKGSKSPAPVRVRDYLEISDVFYLDKNKPRAFIIKTKDKQSFVYKADSLPAYNKITMPVDGNLLENVAEIRNSRQGGLLIKSKQLFKDADIFVYLTALCKKHNLTPGYLINEGEFVSVAEATTKYLVDDKWQNGYFKIKLKEITSPLAMFKFMADIGQEKNRFIAWYFWATGDRKFVSKGEEERAVGDKGVVSNRFQIVFANDRGMEGIEYKREQKKDVSVEKDTQAKEAAPIKKDADTEKNAAIKKEEPVKKDATAEKDTSAKKLEQDRKNNTVAQPTPGTPPKDEVKK